MARAPGLLLLLAAAGWGVALAGRYCKVGFGMEGDNKGFRNAESHIWYRYCGNNDASCFQVETTNYEDMDELYPEKDWKAAQHYATKYYIRGCTGEFHFDQTKGCEGKRSERVSTIWVEDDSEPDGQRTLGFSPSWCCDSDYCNAASLGRGKPHVLVVLALALALPVWLAQAADWR